jgi:FG-GAP-like repeat
LTAGVNTWDVAGGDISGDGALDLVTANSGDDTLSALTNKGNGEFEDAVNYSTGSHPNAVVLG